MNPSWWKSEFDEGWERVKEAVRADWEKTKHDLGWEEAEPALRYGYGARRHRRHREWDDTVAGELRGDYSGLWEKNEQNIRFSFEHPLD